MVEWKQKERMCALLLMLKAWDFPKKICIKSTTENASEPLNRIFVVVASLKTELNYQRHYWQYFNFSFFDGKIKKLDLLSSILSW